MIRAHGRRRARARRTPLVLALAALPALPACGPEPPAGDLRLLPAFAAAADGAGGEAAGDVRPVRIGDSIRQTVATGHDRPRRAAVNAGRGDRLELAVAAVPGTTSPVPVTVSHRGTGGAVVELLRDTAHPADGWVGFVLPLPPGRGELVLASEGPAAWADLYQLRGGRTDGGGRPPNLVLVSLDTVRADHLSLYGYPRPTSPELERFAADAWVFAEAYSASTWTPPSHASMFTGLLPDQHGLRKVDEALPEEAVTIAERLRDAGWRTAAITDGGFLNPQWGFAQGFDRYDVTAGGPEQPKDAAAIFDRAARWAEANRYRPFFLFVHTYEAHQPYDNRGGFARAFLDPLYRGPFAKAVNVLADGARIADADLPRVTALYDGGIRRADHYLGGFLRALGRRGLLETTAVIVTSDHGEELREHGHLEHTLGKVFDENVRVPLVVRPPGGVAAPRRPATAVTGIDLYPTLLDLAGLPPDPGRPPLGRSLLAIAAEPHDPERTVLIQGFNSLDTIDERRLRLDRGQRTLIYDRVRGHAARYDRRADPGMQRPLAALAADGAGAGLVARLQAVLAWLEPGAVATRLPARTAGVGVPAGSGLALRGAWSGLEWRPADGGRSLVLDPARPALAVLDPAAGAGERALEIASAGGGGGRLALARAGGGETATPLDAELPPPGRLLPAAPGHRAGHAEIDPEQAAELRALGYL